MTARAIPGIARAVRSTARYKYVACQERTGVDKSKIIQCDGESRQAYGRHDEKLWGEDLQVFKH